MRRTWFAVAATVTAALTAVPLAAQTAQPAFTARSVAAQVNGTSPDFSDATLTTTAQTNVSAAGAGTRAIDFATLPIRTGSTYASTGGVQLTDVQYLPGNEITGTVSTAGPATGTFSFVNQFAAETDGYNYAYFYRYPNDSTALYPFADPSLPAIEVYLPIGGAGLVDQGGAFSISLSITGDFSATGVFGSASGQHHVLSFDYDNWSVTQDFVYDAVTNTTTFAAINRSYQYGDGEETFDQSPNLDVYFFGSALVAGAAPEPATWLYLIAGFLFAGTSLRRRGYRAVPSVSAR